MSWSYPVCPVSPVCPVCPAWSRERQTVTAKQCAWGYLTRCANIAALIAQNSKQWVTQSLMDGENEKKNTLCNWKKDWQNYVYKGMEKRLRATSRCSSSHDRVLAIPWVGQSLPLSITHTPLKIRLTLKEKGLLLPTAQRYVPPQVIG